MKWIKQLNTWLLHESIKESVSPILPTDRITLIDVDSIDLDRKYEQGKKLMCNGIWYSLGDGWNKWLSTEWPEHLSHYEKKVRLDVDTSNFAKISSIEDLYEFSTKYDSSKRTGLVMIDWANVAKDYDGIEFDDAYHEIKWSYHEHPLYSGSDLLRFEAWFDSVDIPSGCIWNLNKIRGIEILPYVPYYKGEYDEDE